MKEKDGFKEIVKEEEGMEEEEEEEAEEEAVKQQHRKQNQEEGARKIEAERPLTASSTTMECCQLIDDVTIERPSRIPH